MADRSAARPPSWYWIAAGASTLWSLIGCAACYMQLGISEADLAKVPAAQQAIWRMMPLWAAIAYAVAVGFGLAGSLSLLVRKAWAQSLFVVSLIAVVLQFGWTFLATPILSANSRTVAACGIQSGAGSSGSIDMMRTDCLVR